jgi:hypothetical protein
MPRRVLIAEILIPEPRCCSIGTSTVYDRLARCELPVAVARIGTTYKIKRAVLEGELAMDRQSSWVHFEWGHRRTEKAGTRVKSQIRRVLVKNGLPKDEPA